MILAADIGGTKTVLGLISPRHGPHNVKSLAQYPSADFPSFADMIASYLDGKDVSIRSVSIGAAGPVKSGRVEGTNLPWDVDRNAISRFLEGIPVYLINDLEAIASAVPALEQEDIEIIKEGEIAHDGPIAILAPGTGLGEAFLFWDGSSYRAIPSEGGHTDFAPATAEELALLEYLFKKYKHVSYERVCSGIGIPNIYTFLKETDRYPEPGWLRRELASGVDWTPVIIQSAMNGTAPICVETLNMFLGILGSEAGNLALQILATGGIYLGGGIPPRILPKLHDQLFLDAFTRKGRLSDILWQIQINVITNPRAALFGAANHGLVHTQQEFPANSLSK